MTLKKLIIPLATLASVMFFTAPTFAVRAPVVASFTSSAEQIATDGSFTITLSFTAAAWNLHVTSTGPVSGCTFDNADATSDAQDAEQNFTINCTATGAGTIVATLSGDVSIYDQGTIYTDSQSGSVTIIAADSTSGDDDLSGGNPTSDNPTADNGTALPQTYDSINRSLVAVGALSAVMAGVYLYNRSRRG